MQWLTVQNMCTTVNAISRRCCIANVLVITHSNINKGIQQEENEEKAGVHSSMDLAATTVATSLASSAVAGKLRRLWPRPDPGSTVTGGRGGRRTAVVEVPFRRSSDVQDPSERRSMEVRAGRLRRLRTSAATWRRRCVTVATWRRRLLSVLSRSG